MPLFFFVIPNFRVFVMDVQLHLAASSGDEIQARALKLGRPRASIYRITNNHGGFYHG